MKAFVEGDQVAIVDDDFVDLQSSQAVFIPLDPERRDTQVVYRVFSTYHYPDESGTVEGGVFSSEVKAKARLALLGEGYIRPYVVDLAIDDEVVGYT